MRKPFKFILQSILVAFVALTVVSCSDDDNGPNIDRVEIPSGSLPKGSLNTINTYFSDATIKSAYQLSKPNIYSSIYKVLLSNDYEIDFDQDGVWTEIESDDDQAIPEIFLQEELPLVHEYIVNNFAGQYVVEIERERYGFTVELNNDVDLVFDKEQNFIGMDIDTGGDDDDEVRISIEELPTPSHSFLASNFKDISIVTAKRERDDNELSYKVYLSNGIKIEFSSNGNWQEIESNRDRVGVPLSVFPVKIASYIQDRYNGYLVNEAEIEDNGSYKIELENENHDIELEFDRDGNFVKAD